MRTYLAKRGSTYYFRRAIPIELLPERVADVIQGHKPKSVGQTYGTVPLRAMSDAISRVPRFELDQASVKALHSDIRDRTRR